MTPEERAALVCEVASATRETRPNGEIAWAPAFHDLDEEGRREAFEETLTHRRLEAAASPDGLSGTARAVLAKVRAARP
ncbi:MAG TPA: hypothetical protein PLR99_06420 [Polyangiaceae bacterium]|nr:hypothetical protein [Polyangiaceae bacterium]